MTPVLKSYVFGGGPVTAAVMCYEMTDSNDFTDTVSRFVTSWRRGELTSDEVACFVLRNAPTDNIRAIATSLPDTIVDRIHHQIDHVPTDNPGWRDFCMFQAEVGFFIKPDSEIHTDEDRERKSTFRRNVQAFRELRPENT